MSNVTYCIYTVSQLIIFVISLFLPAIQQTAIIVLIILSFVCVWVISKDKERISIELRSNTGWDDYKLTNVDLINAQKKSKEL